MSDKASSAKEIAATLEKSAHEAADTLEDTAQEAAKLLGRKASSAADSLGKGATVVGRGASTLGTKAHSAAHAALVSANQALATPEGADLAPLLEATDLPELAKDGALGSLAVRLDREADLYRNVALRELGRVAWIDRVTLSIVIFAFVGEAAIATAAAFSALVGAIEGKGSLFALAAAILAIAPAGAAAIVASSRRMHRELATDALDRSRGIEDRIFQLGVAMEWQTTEAPLFQDALARLEGRQLKAPD